MGFFTDYQPYIVLLVISVLFVLLFTERVKPVAGFLFASILLVIAGILQPADILEGLSNESIMSVVLLILITAGIRSRFNVYRVLDVIFKPIKTYRYFMATMMTKVAVLSSFVNNTPVVVLMTPYVFEWGKKNKISPSKLLIPLSYSTIVGGMITIVGTSTTLVLSGFLSENGEAPLNHYQLLVVGLAVTVVGIVFILLFGDALLPEKKDLIERFEVNKREYLIEKRLNRSSELIGQSVKDGGLRNLNGVYLVEIVRGSKTISPVAPSEIIRVEDTLIFAGNTDTIMDLSMSKMGLELPASITPSGADNLKVVEAVISSNSSLVGKTIKNSNFRERYDAAVVAIHRNGEKLSGKIGRMTIKSGDVILMYAGRSFLNKADIFKDLYVISGEDLEVTSRKGGFKRLVTLLTVAAGLLIFKPYSLFFSLLIISALMVSMKIITLKNVKRDLDINMVVILVLSLALGQSMVKSGAGALVSQELISLLMPLGNVALLVGMALVTTVLTTFVTNVGAISISFPIAYSLTGEMNMDGAPFYLVIAFAASAAFISPVGYQTNLIVYGPGGYSFKDFFKIGLPVTILYLATAIAIVIFFYKDMFLL